MQRDEQQHLAAQKVTWIGAVTNAVISILKLIIGSIFNSAALVADGIHSLSDLATDFMVVLILRISGKGPDESHPWGHGHFETVGTALLGSLLIAVAGALAYESLVFLFSTAEFQIPEWPALIVAILSVLSKEWIYRYTLAVGKAVKSELLIANAWHSRTDALSSIIVFIGVLGAMAGFPWLDSIAAAMVAIFVAKIGWDLTWNSFKQLVGTALPIEQVTQFRNKILAIEGVKDVHDFKTRTMGSQKLLEFHIQVCPWLSASEGHHIGVQVCNKLKEDQEVGHIIFHIDTYGQQEESTEPDQPALPHRQLITPIIKTTLKKALGNPEFHRINLYYQQGQVDIDILLSKGNSGTDTNAHRLIETEALAQLREELCAKFDDNSWIGEIYLAIGGSD